MPYVAVVADDLTGAADTGVGFLRAGLATTVKWVDPDDCADESEVLAVDTGTRACDEPTAYATTFRTVSALRRAGVRTLYVKVDSTLRGHVGATVKAALAAWSPGAVAVVAPAFPGTGRTTVDGRQRVDGVVLDAPPVPVLLQESGVPAERAVVCDAETDHDLRQVARAATRLGDEVVWVGSGGLAAVLPEVLGLVGTAPPPVPPRTVGPVLVAVGSASPLALEQAGHLAATDVRHARVDPRKDCPEIARHLGVGRDLLLTLDSGSGVDDAGLVEALAAQLRPYPHLVGGLVATGGDTATAILRGWGTTALRLVEEVEPGVPLSVSVAPRPIPVVTKAGGFGAVDTLTRARARLVAMLGTMTDNSVTDVPEEAP